MDYNIDIDEVSKILKCDDKFIKFVENDTINYENLASILKIKDNSLDLYEFVGDKRNFYIVYAAKISEICFSMLLKYDVVFINCDILNQCVEDVKGNIFYSFDKILGFYNCEFFTKIYLENHIFETDIRFCDCKLNEKVYFDNSKFKKTADFNKSEFNKIISFYGVTFYENINFLSCKFKDDLNLVNSKLNLDFDELKKQIKDKKTANDFRDSYRNFKNTLTKQGNTLDALEYHKAELHTKEIELKYKMKNKKDKFGLNYLSLSIDKLLLWFYRATSQHHTNLLKIIICTMFAIGLFGVFNHFTKFISINFICIYFIVILCMLFKKIRFLSFCILSSVNLIITIYYSPNFIFEIYKLLKNKNINFTNIFIFAYVVLISLLLYSLQKTARKNSIIPK